MLPEKYGGNIMAGPQWTLLADGTAHDVAGGADGPVLSPDELARILGWHIADGTLCREDRCVPLARLPGLAVQGGVFLPTLAGALRLPLAIEPAQRVASLAESAEDQGALLRGGVAPEFTLRDLAGTAHRLADYRGRKILLVTWASWCGCREDLPAWEALHAELAPHGLVVMTISQDTRPEDAAPYIAAASPTHPALLDPGQSVSRRYGFINVPTALWIDAGGRIARPARVEHATNVFSFAHGLDCAPHLAALRRWVMTGETDFDAEARRAGTAAPTHDEQCARAHHALALHLHRAGAQAAAEAHWAEAIRLSPFDWTIRRGSMWLRGADPFGSAFAEAWTEWEQAGRPDYASLAAWRAAGAGA